MGQLTIRKRWIAMIGKFVKRERAKEQREKSRDQSQICSFDGNKVGKEIALDINTRQSLIFFFGASWQASKTACSFLH
jgi:hypothetical protein